MAKRYILAGSDYEFEPLGGPIDQPDEFADLFRDIGLAITSWARMEHLLIGIAIHVNKKDASAALHDKNPSKAFGRISDLLQKWLAQHPPYQALVQDTLTPKFFDQLKTLANMRNDIAHGHLRHYEPESGKFFIGTISRSGTDLWKCRVLWYERKGLEVLASLSNLANTQLIKLADRLFVPASDWQPQKP